jgi:choline kinase
MVDLADVPLLLRQLSTLKVCGIEDVTIVTGYLAEVIEGLGYPTRHNDAYDRTNMVASLMCAADLLDGSDDLVISYADIVYEPRVLERLIDCPAPLCITVDKKWRRLWELRSEDPLADAETLRLDALGNVVELGKRPQTLDEIEGQYMGLIKVSAALAPKLVRIYQTLDPEACYDGKNLANMYMTSLLQHLVDLGHPLRAVPVEGGWVEVDTVEDLDRYNEMARDGSLSDFYRAIEFDGGGS